MRWTEHHDTLMLREILVKEPYKHKHGSVERGQIWEEIAEILNGIPEPNFAVTKRSVRDHFNTLSTNYKKRMRDEEKASGISPEITEVDEALADLLERFDQADEEFKVENNRKKAKIEEDMSKAQEIRRKSLETLGETSPSTDATKRRSNGTDTVNYLREKMENDSELKKVEFELKRKEREDTQNQLRQMQEQQNAMLQQMSTSMQQQQQMSLVFMQQQAQQQQQQQALLMALVEKLSKKD